MEYEKQRRESTLSSDTSEQEEDPQLLTRPYLPPVDKLITYTSIKGEDPLPQISYSETFGIGPEHIPELIRMATDDYLGSDDASDFEFAAPLHAVSALAQLHAEAAIEPLLLLYDKASRHENEWMLETLLDVYTTIGPVALPALEQFLADPFHEKHAKNYVAEIVGRIAEHYPDVRAQCIALAIRRLRAFETNDPELNASLISDLVQMKAVEAAPLIQEAYAHHRVDAFFCGDWDEVQYELDLKERPTAKERLSPEAPPFLSAQSLVRSTNAGVHQSSKKLPVEKKAKNKAKMAKASKKANRRKK